MFFMSFVSCLRCLVGCVDGIVFLWLQGDGIHAYVPKTKIPNFQ
jgi:hypothetical protein